MEKENEIEEETKKENNLPPIASIIIVTALVIGAFVYTALFKSPKSLSHPARFSPEQQKEISLQSWVELPIKWDDMGKRMIEAGVIDEKKFENLYAQRGGLAATEKEFLTGSNNGNLMIHPENSGMILNMLWAFGLANKNPILENGPMMNPRYDGTGNFASTGGWTLAQGSAMSHYSIHKFITLTPEQQALVERVAKNIYRPCCDNSTYFPDCNHGMAMLGLLELMASQGVSEADIYKVALQVNALWFPDTYLTIATYMKNKDSEWKDANPQKMLGVDFSSASGYKNILNQITSVTPKGGGGCGV